jgi:hypothetical protein
MFDTIDAIWAGLSGRLKELPRARKIVWVLILAFLAGWAATAFAAWISYPSYFSLIDFIAHADIAALCFTAAIAGFLYFALAYCAGFLNERWMSIPPEERDYYALGFRIFFVACALFLYIDFQMNMNGAEVRAKDAAGAIVTYSYQTPEAVNARLLSDRQKLDDIEGGKVGGYGWRDPRTGIFHLNQSGKRAARSIRESIRIAQQSDSTDRAAFLSDQEVLNRNREVKETRIHQTLRGAVYGVYFLIFLLCIVQAYCVELIQQEQKILKGGRPARAEPKHNPGVLSRLKGWWQGTPEPAVMTAGTEPEEPPKKRRPIGYGTEEDDNSPHDSTTGSIGAMTIGDPIPEADTHRVLDDTRRVTHHGSGFYYECAHCGKGHYKKRPLQEGELPYCSDEHRHQAHADRRKAEKHI